MNKMFIWGLVIIGLLMTVLLVFSLGQSSKKRLENYDSAIYEKAIVLEVLKEAIEYDEALGTMPLGSQQLLVMIESGPFEGERFEVTHYLSVYTPIRPKAGDRVIVSIDLAPSGYTLVTLYAPLRYKTMAVLMVFFVALLIAVGRRKGLMAFLGLLITLLLIPYGLLPMIFTGIPPLIAAIVYCTLATIISLLFLNGWHLKTGIAIIGTVSGTVSAALLAYISASLLHVSGFSLEEASHLIVITKEVPFDIGALLLAAILVASLGAVMDVSVTIASAMNEIHHSNPKQSRSDLFRAGIRVGRDMMGTMTNTLVLAFVGNGLAMLLVVYAYQVSTRQLINMSLLSIEFVKAFSGSMGIVLTVPITALCAAFSWGSVPLTRS